MTSNQRKQNKNVRSGLNAAIGMVSALEFVLALLSPYQFLVLHIRLISITYYGDDRNSNRVFETIFSEYVEGGSKCQVTFA